jgi:hypothetical protein
MRLASASDVRVSGLAYCAAFASSILLGAGCGRTWPAVHPIADSRFYTAGGVHTVDILPMDVGVAVAESRNETPESVADKLSFSASSEVQTQLLVRGYEVAAVIGPDGVYRRADGALDVALAKQDLDSVLASLASFGSAQRTVHDELLVPYLPVRLGQATGADATLYVGGWAYEGEPDDGVTAGDVAKGIIIGLFIVVVIAVLVVAAKGGGHGGGGHGGGGHGGGGGGGSVAAHAAGNAGSAATRALGHAGGAAARGLGRVARTSVDVFRAMGDHPDAWGHHHTHLDVYLSAPEPRPIDAGPSRTALEMTLVDNRSGLVLWHARQEFPANPASPADVRESVARMLAGLPPSR